MREYLSSTYSLEPTNENPNTPLRIVFFRYYDRKISDGTVTFSQVGIGKNDFTRLCTEADFIPDSETVERICQNLRLTDEEAAELKSAAGM